MSNNNGKSGKPDDPSLDDAKRTEDAAKAAKRSQTEEELDEGLDESFPGSDAPTSTRRSERK